MVVTGWHRRGPPEAPSACAGLAAVEAVTCWALGGGKRSPRPPGAAGTLIGLAPPLGQRVTEACRQATSFLPPEASGGRFYFACDGKVHASSEGGTVLLAGGDESVRITDLLGYAKGAPPGRILARAKGAAGMELRLLAVSDKAMVSSAVVSPPPSDIGALVRAYRLPRCLDRDRRCVVLTRVAPATLAASTSASPRGPAGARVTHLVPLPRTPSGAIVAKGRHVTAAAISRLSHAGSEPLFVYLHLLEPHEPYTAGAEDDPPWSRYLARVQEVDAMLARIVRAIDDLGIDDRTILVLTADHGEAFGERGTRFHATTVYEELLRVPVLVRAKGVKARRVDTPVTLLDIGPTVLDLFGQPTPGSYMGQSLVPFLRGDNPALSRPIAAETGRRQRALVYPDGFKAIEDLRRHTAEVYNLVTDPGERADRLDDPDGEAAARLREMRAFFRRNGLRRPGYRPPFRP